MGMFDRVKRDAIKCPTCGKTIDDFQTKSGHCHLFNLTEDELIADAKRLGNDEPYYYGYCNNCMTRVDFSFVPGRWEHSFETQEQRKEEAKKSAEFWEKYRTQNNNV